MIKSKKLQQGISLYIVIIIVLLSMLLALWSSRTAIFNEMIVGNDADYQRAYEAAEAMIQDAEIDVQKSGDECNTIDKNICRQDEKIIPIYEDFRDIDGPLIDKLDVSMHPTGCLHGVCLKRANAQDFWNNKEIMKAMIGGDTSKKTNVAARYGQYTGVTTNSATNPILSERAEGRGAWYWIEIIKHNDDLSISKEKGELIYRVTAIARGMKPSTQVVLQKSFFRLPPSE